MCVFPGSSAGKESTCHAGDLGSIPGFGRFPGEGIGYPLQYSWASLVAQMVKNPPAMRETWIQSLGWEDPLENGKATHTSLLAWRIPWTIQSLELQRVEHDWATFTSSHFRKNSPIILRWKSPIGLISNNHLCCLSTYTFESVHSQITNVV